MYLTDFREQSLVDVIESLDTQLFEKVTGLTLDDFHKLSEVGVFHPAHMNEAIWQFRLFEEASLDYLGAAALGGISSPQPVGLWDRTIEKAVPPLHDLEPTLLDSPGFDPRFAFVVDQGLLSEGDILTAEDSSDVTAIVTGDYGLTVNELRYETPDAAARAGSNGRTECGWTYWVAEGYGTLQELAELAEG